MKLVVSDEIFYLVESDGGKDVGLVCLCPWKDDTLIAQVNLGEDCRGRKAGEAYRNALEWAFRETNYTNVFGIINSENKASRFMARNVNFKFGGIDCDGYRCYNMSKSDFEQRNT